MHPNTRLPSASSPLRLSLCVMLAGVLAACGGNGASADTQSAGAPQAAGLTPEMRASTQALTGGSDFSVAHLPEYEPKTQITGEIRNYGFGFGGILEKWQAEFQTFHPGVTFKNTLPTSDAAFPGLVTYSTDIAPMGSEPAITETLGFFETRGYHVSQVVVASGAYDTKGRSNGPVIFVHKDNPLAQLSVDQLDGIFGSERNGEMRGFEWTPTTRGIDKDIRTWGQLGLTGDWADKPIQTYGHAPSGVTRFFQLHVLGNTEKWNPNYRGYVETGSKMISPQDKAEQRLGVRHMLEKELAQNPYGMAWTIMSQAEGIEGIKPLALAARGSRDYVTPSQASFQDRSYPLVRSIYLYYDRKPGDALDPKVKEFLRYALSRQGQQLVADGDYLPLTARVITEQLDKLE
ncbi:MAG: phosphate ABC transporter substrate-binding protein [Stenotrophomonas acidaminiphila]|nr:MAG: phosphate ABC transporter substrate-binding protein [Stenotrophomonas acidaminiphila]